MKINIVGAGPRGLSTVLYALYKNYEVNLIDPFPLHTWSSDYLIEDLEMRSPITFDLVTFVEELQDFRLANYLNYNIPFTNNQVSVESCNIKVTRKEFCEYINWIYKLINKKVKVIKDTVIGVEGNNVKLSKGKVIKGDAIIFCTGYKGIDNTPNWLQKTSFSNKRILLFDILKSPLDYLNKKWLVIGSGQGAAEQVDYFSKLNGKVYWAMKKVPKVYQYPAPNYQLWGTKTALGEYYRNLKDNQQKLAYLNKVKEWQPSITSYINNKLNLTNYTQIIIKDYIELQSLDIDYLSLASGITPSFNTLPVKVPNNFYLPNFPDITNNFKINYSKSNWYVSGVLATAFDGPRQHSLISAGLTAKEIIENIENGNI